MSTNYLKFWGTRGSIAVSGEEYRHFGGNSSCLEICYEGRTVIIDAGTGIRPLGFDLVQRNIRTMDLILTHTHWDHIIGLPFFEPIYQEGVHLTVWSMSERARSSEELFRDLFATEFFPVGIEEVRSQIEFRTIHPHSPIHIGSIVIDAHPVCHPGKAYGFKFQLGRKKIGYISDNELLPDFQGDFVEGLVSFFHNCDLLIHEAQYFPEEYRFKEGWGHSSVQSVIPFIQRTRPGQWLVTHHDPCHTDADLFRMADLAKQYLAEQNMDCPVEWLPDGYIIHL